MSFLHTGIQQGFPFKLKESKCTGLAGNYFEHVGLQCGHPFQIKNSSQGFLKQRKNLAGKSCFEWMSVARHSFKFKQKGVQLRIPFNIKKSSQDFLQQVQQSSQGILLIWRNQAIQESLFKLRIPARSFLMQRRTRAGESFLKAVIQLGMSFVIKESR